MTALGKTAALRETRSTTPRSHRFVLLALVVPGVALVVFGVVLRVWIVDHLPINSDEAVVGLMSLGILHGHFAAVTWGQTYGGVEPYLTSVLFALFGHSDTTLNLTPVVLSFTASMLVYVIGRHYLPRVLAVAGALAVWVWPAIVVRNGTQELGYRFACLNLGLLAILCAMRLRDRGASKRRLGVLGLALGLCLWANPDSIYFLVPCAMLVTPLVVRGWSSDRKKTATELLYGMTGVFVGGLPFFWATFSNHTIPISPSPGTVTTRASALVTHAAPLAVGVQVPGSGAWFGGRAVGVVVFVAFVVAVAVGSTWALLRPRPGPFLALVAFVVAYPIIYALLPGTWYWQDGRYIVYLPYLLVVVALHPLGLVRWRRLVVVATTIVVLGAGLTTAVELTRAEPGLSLGQLPKAFTVSRLSLAPLARTLEQHRIRLGYAGYWVAYNVDFESGGALTFTPTSSDSMRNATYLHDVARATKPAWIVCRPGESQACTNVVGSSAVDPPGVTWSSLRSWLRHRHIAFTSVSADGFAVIVPSSSVTPALVR